MARVLLLHGGWEGHHPDEMADAIEHHLLKEYEVIRSGDLSVLQKDVLREFDLLLPVWTFGHLQQAHEEALLTAVADGLGLLGLHGHASAFLESRLHKLMIGGQFMCHPGGEEVTYTVTLSASDPLTVGLEEFSVTSEQYYLLVDPAVTIAAWTHMVGEEYPWLKGVRMPVLWRRNWGQGRVVYCSLGHSPREILIPTVQEMLGRSLAYCRRPSSPKDSKH